MTLIWETKTFNHRKSGDRVIARDLVIGKAKAYRQW